MLVFVDEYGDTGAKFDHGSSDILVIALVLFADAATAQQTEARINQLRADIGKPAAFEFHFKNNPNDVRTAFFQAVAACEFQYTGLIADKRALHRSGHSLGASFYHEAISEAFAHLGPFLQEADVTLDRSGGKKTQQEIAARIKQQVNAPDANVRRVRRVSVADSHRNNLLQLADMVCGALARWQRPERQNEEGFRKIIVHREIPVRIWTNK